MKKIIGNRVEFNFILNWFFYVKIVVIRKRNFLGKGELIFGIFNIIF